MATYYACPTCSKKGVTFRLNATDDLVACRYCEFYAYLGGNDRMDVEARAALAEANPELAKRFNDDTTKVSRWGAEAPAQDDPDTPGFMPLTI